MTMSTSHLNNFPKRISELLAGYVAGNLDPDELAEVQQLLTEHPELMAEVRALDQTLEQLVESFVAAPPPDHLSAQLLAAAQSSIPRKLSHRAILPWGRIATGALAAALVLSLAVDNYRMRMELSRTAAIVDVLHYPGTRTFTLRGMPVAQQSSGTMMVNLDQETAAIALSNLPSTPRGQVYRLWAMIGNEKVPCGEPLPAQTAATFRDRFPISPTSFPELYDPRLTGILITLEASRNAPQPTGPVILSSL